jgi:hypothetical protein
VTTLDNNLNKMLPKLYSVYSLGCLYTTSCNMVQYRPVDTDKLRSLSLADSINISSHSKVIKNENSGKKKETSKLSQQLLDSEIGDDHGNNYYDAVTNTDLEFIVAQINAGHDLFITVGNFLDNNPEKCSKKLSVSKSIQYFFLKLIEIPITIIAWIWFIIVFFTKKIIDYRFPNISNIIFGYWYGGSFCNLRGKRKNSNRDLLAGGVSSSNSNSSISENCFALHCLSEKFQIMERLLLNCGDFTRSWELPAEHRQKLWIDVNSHIVVIIVDIVLGIFIGQFLFRHSKIVTSFIAEAAIFLQYDILRTTIESFKHSPLGIKLNPLITKTIGHVLKLLIKEFAKLVYITAPVHDIIMRVIACSGSLGMSIQLAIIIDLTTILTAHIVMIHKLSSILHKFQCELIFSLYQLFRGRKVNILRKRLDTCEYDRIQLLFGVTLFSMVFFLFPSFAAYFYLFSIAQGFVLLLQVLLWSVIVFILEFPYYPAAMWLCDPLSVTKGIRFHLIIAAPIREQKAGEVEPVQKPRQHQHYKSLPLEKISFPFLSSPKSPVTPSVGLTIASSDDDFNGTSYNSEMKDYGNKENIESGVGILSDERSYDGSQIEEEEVGEGNQTESTVTPSLREERASKRMKEKEIEVPTTTLKQPLSPKLPTLLAKGTVTGDVSGRTSATSYSNTLHTQFPGNAPGGFSSTSPRVPGGLGTSTIYLLLSASPVTLWKLFSKYCNYLSCFTSKAGLISYIFNGIIYGSPHLDIYHVKDILKINRCFDYTNNYHSSIYNSENDNSKNIDSMSGSKVGSVRAFLEVLNVVSDYTLSTSMESSPYPPHDTADSNSGPCHELDSLLQNSTPGGGLGLGLKGQIQPFVEPKIHKRLNKTLLFYVLLTYVFSLASLLSGVGIFAQSLTMSDTNGSKFTTIRYKKKGNSFSYYFRGGVKAKQHIRLGGKGNSTEMNPPHNHDR